MKTILEEANNILFKRSEEKERQYGPMTESIERAAKIATLMGKKELTADDVYNVIIAIKLSREAHSHKKDNILDAIVYLAAKNEDLEI